MRRSVKFGLFLLPVTLGLFFGLFFGVTYPEIVRSGWPLTRCDIRSSQTTSRYCCEKQCSSGCASAPFGAPSCSSQISSINNGFSPSRCSNDSSTCPTSVGQACDGGYKCCSRCCDTCQSCTNTCSSTTPTTCTQTCTSRQCNCRCCSSTASQYCTLLCPICFAVELDVTFYTGRTRSEPHNTTYRQDFQKESGNAQAFSDNHPDGSSSSCYYNPQNLSEVSFDVSFTPWKWAVTSIFGFLPLLVNILFFVFMFGILPIIRKWKHGFRGSRSRPVPQEPDTYKSRGVVSEKASEDLKIG